MLGKPLLVQHTVNVAFARHAGIRRSANDIEDAIAKGCPGGYQAPQVIPVPDGLGPDVPRMIFSSLNGFSQIMVSEVSVALIVTYSEDWQAEYLKCRDYIMKRSAVLFDLLKAIDAEPHYSGISTKVHMYSPGPNDDGVAAVRQLLNLGEVSSEMNEINLRWSITDDPYFYRNMVVQSVKSWGGLEPNLDRLMDGDVVAVGVEIVSDSNDRRGYNERDGYRTSIDKCLNLIDCSHSDSMMWAGRIGGGSVQ